jgi:hypothetical protein
VNRSIRASCVVALLGAVATFGVVGSAVAADAPKSDAMSDPKTEVVVAKYTLELINRMDADKNGEVSKAEFMDYMSKEFDRLDVNHDGKLQQGEILNKEMFYRSGPGSHR